MNYEFIKTIENYDDLLEEDKELARNEDVHLNKDNFLVLFIIRINELREDLKVYIKKRIIDLYIDINVLENFDENYEKLKKLLENKNFKNDLHIKLKKYRIHPDHIEFMIKNFFDNLIRYFDYKDINIRTPQVELYVPLLSTRQDIITENLKDTYRKYMDKWPENSLTEEYYYEYKYSQDILLNPFYYIYIYKYRRNLYYKIKIKIDQHNNNISLDLEMIDPIKWLSILRQMNLKWSTECKIKLYKYLFEKFLIDVESYIRLMKKLEKIDIDAIQYKDIIERTKINYGIKK
jgi:hypothetical protein